MKNAIPEVQLQVLIFWPEINPKKHIFKICNFFSVLPFSVCKKGFWLLDDVQYSSMKLCIAYIVKLGIL